jgi:hypothetical protein
MPRVDVLFESRQQTMHRFRDKDLRLSITAVLLLTLVGLRPLDAKSTAKDSQQSRAFTEALAEARRLAETEAGKAFQAEFGKIVALNPNYARAYYNRTVAKEAKGDKAGAEADFKTAEKLDPELASQELAADSKDNRPSGATTVSLLDGKLKIDLLQSGTRP